MPITLTQRTTLRHLVHEAVAHLSNANSRPINGCPFARSPTTWRLKCRTPPPSRSPAQWIRRARAAHPNGHGNQRIRHQ